IILFLTLRLLIEGNAYTILSIIIRSNNIQTTMAAEQTKTIRGGEFISRDTEASEVFIPEEFSEEQTMIAQTCTDFLRTEVWPRLEELDSAKSPELITMSMD